MRGNLVLDEDIILERISKVEKFLIELEEIKKLNFEDASQLRNLLATERLLQISIQSCIDIGNHIISVKNFKKPETYSEIFEILKKEKVISEKLADKLIEMTKFRNILVHFYIEIDEKIVYDIVQTNLDDFRDFIKEIRKLLEIS